MTAPTRPPCDFCDEPRPTLVLILANKARICSVCRRKANAEAKLPNPPAGFTLRDGRRKR
jgi:hypothetical protein